MLERCELRPGELAMTITNSERYFVPKASGYRLLMAHDLINSSNFTVMMAASEFKGNAPAINQLRPTNFSYLKMISWGWFYLSTVRNDYPR